MTWFGILFLIAWGTLMFTLVAYLCAKDTLFVRRLLGEKTYEELSAERDVEVEAKKRKILDVTHAALSAVPEEHLITLLRKRKLLRLVDDYGTAQTDAWDKELRYYFDTVLSRKIAEIINPREDDELAWEILFELEEEEWIEVILGYVDNVLAAARVEGTAEAPTNPYEYEVYCAEILETDGWNARRTSGSGDQGADVIAEKDGVRVVIQCKLFSSPVGNKAVQEVTSAKIFYDARHAVVVSNQSYTPSAKKLANATGVILMHHDDLVLLPDKLSEVI